MRRVCIYVFAGTGVDSSILTADENPGIGGSQFTAFRLARLLAETSPEREIVVLTEQPVAQFAKSPIDSVRFEQWTDWKASHHDCAVITNSEFRNVDVVRSVQDAGRIVGWSRHPFDKNLLTADLPRIDAVVSPGVFALASNELLGFPGVHIPHYITPRPDVQPRKIVDSEAINFVFMSSGLPIKGFWDVLEIWRRIRARVPQAQLHIIGEVPMPTPASAPSRLASMFASDLNQGRIVLHGVVGTGKLRILKCMHVGIVNPRALSECFSATAFELLGCGIPIVSSMRHGMFESMRYFPEARAATLSGIARKAIRLSRDSVLYADLASRGQSVVDEVYALGPEIASRWLRLVDDSDLAATRRQLAPLWPLPRRALRLLSGAASLLHYRFRIRRRWMRLGLPS